MSTPPVAVSSPSLSPDVLRPVRRRGYPTAWWGMVMLIATEAMVFVLLIASYLFLRASAPRWPPAGIELPKLDLATPFSFVLWGSSVPIFWVESAIRKGRMDHVRLGLLISFVMGLGFVGYTLYDFNTRTFGWWDNAYASSFYTIVGLHLTHVIVGLAMSAIVQIKAWQNKFNSQRHITLDVFSLYWHFVDAVWLVVFPTLFVSVHIK
jgi:heme/copper-type cytochrome/quinol oxidase subunit 3